MKKVFLSLLFIGGMFSGLTAQDEAPKALLAKFKEKYANAEEPYWYEAEDGNYTVEFSLNENMLTVLFDTKAEILKIQKSLNENQLPADIKKMLAQKFEGAQLLTAMQIKEKDKDMYFALQLESGEAYVNLQSDTKGKVLLEEREAIETYDDSDLDEE